MYLTNWVLVPNLLMSSCTPLLYTFWQKVVESRLLSCVRAWPICPYADMCGIFFSLGLRGHVYPEEDIAQLLRDRGPDFYGTHHVEVNRGGQPIYLTFISTVLSLRGDHIYEQPLVDSTSGSVLCWNGEAWKIGGERVTENDTVLVFGLLRQAVEPVPRETETDVLSRLVGAISQISGPFSFVFYDGFRSRVYYGRDVLGRRSLLSGYSREGVFEICSVCDNLDTNGFEEIQSDGIRMIDIEHLSLFHHPSVEVRTVPGTNGADNDSVGMVRFSRATYLG